MRTGYNISTTAITLVLGLLSAATCHAQSSADAEPNKANLIRTLEAVVPLLEQKDFGAASEHFVLPPDFKSEMLDGFIERREISAEGVRCLAQDAKFAAGAELFGAERAAELAARAGVNVEDCYGFKHEVGGQVAEVLAVWKENRFKLARLDDVGKIQASESPETQPAPQSLAELLPVLASAVEQNPTDIGLRARLAMALYKTGNFPAAWKQLLAARKLDPEHGGVAKGIETLLTEFERRGLFTAGTPAETIESVLGPTNQKVDLGTRQRWVYVYLGVDFAADRVHEIIDLRGATNALFQPTEYVSVDLDGRGWACGHRKKSRGSSAAYYYLPGQNIANWKEQFEVERILGGAAIGSADALAKKIVEQVTARHPGAESKLLHLDGDTVTVAFELPGREGYEKRHQLVRLMVAAKDVHRIAYTIKVDQPTAETRATWSAIMKAATLTPVE